MSNRIEIVQQFLQAQRSREADKIDGLRQHLADNATMIHPRQTVSGADSIIEHLKNPPQRPGGMGGGMGGGGGMAAMMNNLPTPVEEGNTVKLDIQLPPGLPMPIKGISYGFTFDNADKIDKIEMQMQRSD